MIYILIVILYVVGGIMYTMLSAEYLSSKITNVVQALVVILTWPYFLLREYFDIFR